MDKDEVTVFTDYRYWNDPSDEFKDGEGSLLPLWKFSYEKTKKHDVTDLCFNSRYYDLFAVSFGASKILFAAHILIHLKIIATIQIKLSNIRLYLKMRILIEAYYSVIRHSNCNGDYLSLQLEKSLVSGMDLHD